MISITPSHIIQYLYCPRFIYFENVLNIPQYEARNYKVMRGRHLHDERLERNKGYLRKRIGVVKRYDDQYLTNESLRGRVDEVLIFNDGTMAPLDYKFAKYEGKVYRTYKTQLVCYAILIEENFQNLVQRGFLVYTRSKNKVEEVDILDEDKVKVKLSIRGIQRIVEENFFPPATKFKKQCLTCTYKNICIQ